MAKLVLISDTHACHDDITVPPGDILIHAGDALSRGAYGEYSAFRSWFCKQPHRLKIYVPGNHDTCLADPVANGIDVIGDKGMHILIERKIVDEESGLSFYGVPWTPDFFSHRWAFNYCQSGRTPEEIWDAVPDGIDVLISHGPPRGWGDRIRPGREHLGCSEIAKTIARVKPRLFVCGHIHGGYGARRWESGVQWVNASICNERYQPLNKPIVIDVPALPR